MYRHQLNNLSGDDQVNRPDLQHPRFKGKKSNILKCSRLILSHALHFFSTRHTHTEALWQRSNWTINEVSCVEDRYALLKVIFCFCIWMHFLPLQYFLNERHVFFTWSFLQHLAVLLPLRATVALIFFNCTIFSRHNAEYIAKSKFSFVVPWWWPPLMCRLQLDAYFLSIQRWMPKESPTVCLKSSCRQ